MAPLIGLALVPGEAEGPALAFSVPLSFWGGLDPATGLIVDRSHPGLGRSVTGTILVLPSGRGSSSSSAVLAEAIRRGMGPAGILLGEPDPIIAVGAIVALRLYGHGCPIVVAPAALDGAAGAERIALSAREHGPATVTLTGRRG